jgi:uncharacterized protein (TIGR02145 family)
LNLTNRFADKAPVNNPSFTGTVGGMTKAMVGLSDVNNTSDLSKPVSSATQAALETKFNISDFPSGNIRGEFLYWNGSRWESLQPGEPGQFIIMDSNRNLTWGCIFTNTVDMPSSNPTLVVNTPLTDITIATTGVTGIGIVQGLPNGVTATWASDTITISGTPNDDQRIYDYFIELTGGCGRVVATGTITVTAVPPVCPTATITYNSDTYNTVAIGTQCWMAENLRTRKYNDGTDIPFDASGEPSGSGQAQTWGALTSGAHTLYAHDSTATPSNLISYGYLYNWYAVKGIVTSGGTPELTKNICPIGWNVPTDNDWKILTDTLGGIGVAGTLMKSKSYLWSTSTPWPAITNSSGFSALPGGYRFSNGSFLIIRVIAFFWSATENDGNKAWSSSLNSSNGSLVRSNYSKSFGASVRCLKNSL